MLKRYGGKPLWISLGVVACLVALVTLWLITYPSLQDRLTESVRATAVHGGIFTKSKLISYHEDYTRLNLNGDGEIEGVYQLTPDEIRQLLSADPPLVCSSDKPCRATETHYDPGSSRASYTATVDVIGEALLELSIDVPKSQVTWHVTWY